MAITLSTNIPQLLFSSAIPDLAINTDTDGEVEIALSSGNTNVFTASYFPYNRKIKVFDLRSVVEMYLREQNESLMDFTVTATANEVTHQLCSFKVVYLEHRFDGDISEFLRNNFLTNTSSKMTSEKAVEHLHFFLDAGEETTIRYEIVTQQQDEEPRLTIITQQMMIHNRAMIFLTEISCLGIREMASLSEDTKLLAYSVHIGNRAYTYYVSKREPQVTLYFRNAFNYFECCQLDAVTTQIAESDRSIAVTNRISTFYNQRNEKKYEVETSGLTYEQAQWIEQLFYSHDVRMGFRHDQEPGEVVPEIMPKILITDFTCEISDADGELNSVKFTFQFADRRTYLQTDYLTVDHDRIFTQEYDPTFQ